ncbi:hypothetical protein, partial [Lactobacillus nasalidis]|uniref:hypothetical protein n=2 Tax=Lactobacillus nasalidis TaxID=2797258 RepID=UPI00191544C4
TAAGYTYSGERFAKYFKDFAEKYHFADMYAGGFYPYPSLGEFWAYWSRYIWINRYAPIPTDLYRQLLDLVRGKDYFVLTTNVDHCFQRSGFDKKRLFYTQGDYGLFQSLHPSGPSAGKTYDNYEMVREMLLAQGWQFSENNDLLWPAGGQVKMTIPDNFLPFCPDDGQAMTTNLRIDEDFVQDAGWQQAAGRYRDFLLKNAGKKIVYLELGVGMNTPAIIKYPFWQLTAENKNAFYICVNQGEAGCSEDILDRSLLINGGIAELVDAAGKLPAEGEK